MVVGEPTLMGGEFGDKDERLIARLENTQYDPSEQQDEGAADQCVRLTPGATAPSTTTFGAPPPVTVAQSRARPCPPVSPAAIHSPWGMDKLAVPPPHSQSSSIITNDKLSSEFE